MPDNHYNCPIVTSYAENIKNNVEELTDAGYPFLAIPSWPSQSEEILTKQLVRSLPEEFSDPGIRGEKCRRS